MKSVVVKIILFALCAALIVGVVIPLANQIRDTGQKSFDSVKNLSDNIKDDT